MGKGDIWGFYFTMIDRFLAQKGLTPSECDQFRVELHESLKEALGIESISKGKMTDRERWQFAVDAEMILIRDYGYMVDEENNNALNFDNEQQKPN